MQVKQLGALDQIELPPDFALADQSYARMARDWRQRYYAHGDEAIQIVLYYRGKAENIEDTKTFRSILDNGPFVYLAKNKIDNDINSVTLKLRLILGNVGDNQYSRKFTEYTGQHFNLTAFKVAPINGRLAIHVIGQFISVRETIDYYYQGIFFDGTPGDKNCNIEEVFLQTESEGQFEQYKESFEQSLATIQWTHAATRI